MSTFEIGVLYIGAAFLLFFSGVPIAFALGSVALLFMFLFMPPACRRTSPRYDRANALV